MHQLVSANLPGAAVMARLHNLAICRCSPTLRYAEATRDISCELNIGCACFDTHTQLTLLKDSY